MEQYGKDIMFIFPGLAPVVQGNMSSETVEACARRECLEETGYRPGKLHKLLT